MHLPLLNAYDPYMRGADPARRDRRTAAEVEPFVIESALEKPDGGADSFAGARRDGKALEPKDPLVFEHALADACSASASGEDCGAPMPEDALDAQDLCAMLQAAAGS